MVSHTFLHLGGTQPTQELCNKKWVCTALCLRNWDPELKCERQAWERGGIPTAQWHMGLHSSSGKAILLYMVSVNCQLDKT